jgi:polar amino acid transport system ATP-binding protein
MGPAVLPCDEIASAPDPELARVVLEVVELLADPGMTLMTVMHEMNAAREVADRVVFMHAGRLHGMAPRRRDLARRGRPACGSSRRHGAEPGAAPR